MDILVFLAQTTVPTTQPTEPALFRFFREFGWLILIFVIFYFLVIRSKQKQDRGRRDMLGQLKKGDEVQTIGGEFGKVVEVRDDRVLLKVDESSNTKVWYARSAIHRVTSQDKADAK